MVSMIDWGRVNDLAAEIGADDLAEVVALFLEEADEVIERITTEAGAGPLEADLHFLKGAALNLGFESFAALCQEGELRAATGDTAVDLVEICSVYSASKQAFAAGQRPECAT